MSNKRHGHYGSPTYLSYWAMRRRCEKGSFEHFDRYGGRGISICERWMKFENFLADMGERPEGMTLERIDNNGNYEPKNCKWATKQEQANNKSSSRFIEFNGKRQTLSAWARQYKISVPRLANRLDKGWPVELALKTPTAKENAKSAMSGGILVAKKMFAHQIALEEGL